MKRTTLFLRFGTTAIALALSGAALAANTDLVKPAVLVRRQEHHPEPVGGDGNRRTSL